MLKRILSFILCVILVLPIFASTAYAKSLPYQISEIGMSIELPDHYDVYTRDMDMSSPLVVDYGYTEESLMEEFTSYNKYLFAYSIDNTSEFEISVTGSYYDDFSSYSDPMLIGIAAGRRLNSKDEEIEVVSTTIFDTGITKYICEQKIYSGENSIMGFIEYNTTFLGKDITISFYRFHDDLRDADLSMVEQVINSVTIDTSVLTSLNLETPWSFEYYDSVSGFSFLIPAGWFQEPDYNPSSESGMRFNYVKEDDLCIIYTCDDAWGQLSSADKVGKTRADIDTSVFKSSDVCMMASMSGASDYDLVTYGNHDFYRFVSKSDSEINPILTFLLALDHSYMVTFLFAGQEGDPMYSDFVRIVSSLEYYE
ncbi:MAG: hypothetical protein IJV40_09630 [Oscillospiraceae bacterium]|nr:hypothetical protein [Oscillospiraceae bacterium]